MAEATPEQGKQPWYFKTSSLVVAFLAVGPFALPLLWLNPRHSMLKKILWTVGIVWVTYVLTMYSIAELQKLTQQLRDAGLMK